MVRMPTGVPIPLGAPPMMPLPATPNVVSAGPQLINRGKDDKGDGLRGATIEAKAQIR